MPLKFFHISSRDSAPMEAELNAFLSRHRVVTVDRRFVECGADSFWALCVDYLHGEPGAGSSHGAPGRAERKVDYKELLPPEQFEVFSKLYLGPVDRLVREHLRVPGYVRFMDDFILWEDDPARLREYWRAVKAVVEDDLGLALKPSAHMNRSAHGVDFCGFRHFPGWRVLNRRSLRRLRARVLEIEREPSESAQQSRAQAVFAFAKEGDTWHQRRRALARASTA
jgi:hypothetical protein